MLYYRGVFEKFRPPEGVKVPEINMKQEKNRVRMLTSKISRNPPNSWYHVLVNIKQCDRYVVVQNLYYLHNAQVLQKKSLVNISTTLNENKNKNKKILICKMNPPQPTIYT